MGRRFGFMAGLWEMARSKSSLCVKSFWFILLISKPPLFYRGDVDVHLQRTQMEFGQTSTFERLCFSAKHVFILAVSASQWCYGDRTVDSSAKAWQRCWKALTLQSIVYLWKYYYVLNICYSSLVLKVTLYHKIALRALRRSCFLSLTPCDSAGKCFTLCISVVPFYELWVTAGKYKRAWRSCFWCL